MAKKANFRAFSKSIFRQSKSVIDRITRIIGLVVGSIKEALALGVAIVQVIAAFLGVLGFGIGGLAAAFATLASIFQFQIIWALGFFFLTIICWVITVTILTWIDHSSTRL